MSLVDLQVALASISQSTAGFTDQIIKHSKLWKQIAEGPMGGYLDTLTHLIELLHNPALDRAVIQQKIFDLQNLMRLVGYGDFDAGDYEHEFERLRRGSPTPRKLTPPVTPGGGSGKMILGISLKNGQVVIDILNDSGGAGGSKWYDPNDPNYKLLQSSGQLPKGNG
jgi:hypothetical protein